MNIKVDNTYIPDREIECTKFNFKQCLDLLPGIWCVVDRHSRFIYYNKAYAELAGIEHLPADFLLGKTRESIPANEHGSTGVFWFTDRMVISSKKKISALHCIQVDDGNWRVLQVDKQPVLNSANEVEALIFQFIDQTANQTLDLALAIEKQHQSAEIYEINGCVLLCTSKFQQQIDLKPKESECLFYLSRGFPYKQIALMQNVTYRTIVDRIERLKIKFGVSTTTQLISKALIGGHYKHIPKNVFHKSMVIVLHD